METKLTLSNNFPFVYSLVKCFYSSENIFLRNFEIKQVKGIDMPVSSNDILCLPVTTIDKASIYLIDFLLINAKKQKSDIDNTELNNFYAFSVGIIKYVYSNSYLKQTELDRVSAKINRETFFLPSHIFYDLIAPAFKVEDYTELDILMSLADQCEVEVCDKNISINLLNMHHPIGDFAILDSLMAINKVDSKTALTKFVSDSNFNPIFTSIIKEFYQDDFSYGLFMFLICMKYDISYNLDLSILYKEINLKTATSRFSESPFWIFGLIEKMLESARGPDYTVKKVWDPYVKEIYQMIEKSRRDKRLSGATMEFMLRVLDSNDNSRPELIEKVMEDIRYDQ